MEVRGSVRRVGLLAALGLLAGPPVAAAQTQPPLRAVPQGAAVRLSTLQSDARYRDTFLREFDSLTPENELKMAALQPLPRPLRLHAPPTSSCASRCETARPCAGTRSSGASSCRCGSSTTARWTSSACACRRSSLPQLPNPLGKILDSTTTLLTGWSRERPARRHEGPHPHRHAPFRRRHQGVGRRQRADRRRRHARAHRLAALHRPGLRRRRRCAPRAPPTRGRSSSSTTTRSSGRARSSTASLALVRDLKARRVPLDGIGLQAHWNIADPIDEATLDRDDAPLRAHGARGRDHRDGRRRVAARRRRGPTGCSARLPPTAPRRARATPSRHARASRPGASPTPSRGSRPAQSGLLFDRSYRPSSRTTRCAARSPRADALRVVSSSSADETLHAPGRRAVRHGLRPAGRARVGVAQRRLVAQAGAGRARAGQRERRARRAPGGDGGRGPARRVAGPLRHRRRGGARAPAARRRRACPRRA